MLYPVFERWGKVGEELDGVEVEVLVKLSNGCRSNSRMEICLGESWMLEQRARYYR